MVPPPEASERKKMREKAKETKMSLITEELKAKAEVYYGDAIGRDKSKLLLQEVGLPRSLLPLKDIIEVGYVEETGFVWLRQKKKIEHCFTKIGRQVSYGKEITAYVEKFRIKKLTRVKAKELLVWLTLTDIYTEDPSSGKLICKTSTGLYRTFPFSTFELEEDRFMTRRRRRSRRKMIKSKHWLTKHAGCIVHTVAW